MRNDPLRLAIDIGGTFTDSVLARGDTILASAKTLTTHADPGLGAYEGAARVLDQTGVAFSNLAGFVHGTTLATNALIERRGAHAVTITTEGFRDILDIAYERRYAQYDIDLQKPELLVPRHRALTVKERMNVQGKVLIPLEDSTLDAVIAQVKDLKAEAVAICLIHAYANPAHERALREAIHAALPEVAVSISSEVSPEAREYDRLCTTLANAYIQPLMDHYLARFEARFQDAGVTCPILMMTASGGMCTLDQARAFPIRLVESGPAGGAILAARVARQIGADDVLSFDMGGTTAKLCLIDNARPQTARSFEIARAARFIKGSGMPVRIPVIDMIEIGAGGGSIASVDGLGRLSVGPKSAGSEPGPVAFGRGGEAPTVTDADAVQGFLQPDVFAEGQFTLDVASADRALADQIGVGLNADGARSAAGVSAIVDENMAAAARMHAVESGKDIAARTMIAFGGNGPLHATRVARAAGVDHIIIPPDPGVGSAVGFLFAPVSFELVRSFYQRLDDLKFEAVNGLLAEMEEVARNVVRQGAPEEKVETRRVAFMRYAGQGHEIDVALPKADLAPADLPDLIARFEAAYRAQFSRPVPGMVIEVLNWAVEVATPTPTPADVPEKPASELLTVRDTVEIRCDVSGKPVEAARLLRNELSPGDRIDGPALVIEPQTTTLISADFSAIVDGGGNLRLTRNRQERAP